MLGHIRDGVELHRFLVERAHDLGEYQSEDFKVCNHSASIMLNSEAVSPYLRTWPVTSLRKNFS